MAFVIKDALSIATPTLPFLVPILLGIFVDRMIYCILQLISFVFAEQE
jgi:hypothetical protein